MKQLPTWCQSARSFARQYKKCHHDRIAHVIRWQLCKAHDIEHAEKWYDHKPEKGSGNKTMKILWGINIQTDKVLENPRPDIVVFDKDTRSWKVVDVACRFDTRVVEKEKEKLDKYQDLKYELKRVWNCSEVIVIAAVIGALGTISKNCCKRTN